MGHRCGLDGSPRRGPSPRGKPRSRPPRSRPMLLILSGQQPKGGCRDKATPNAVLPLSRCPAVRQHGAAICRGKVKQGSRKRAASGVVLGCVLLFAFALVPFHAVAEDDHRGSLDPDTETVPWEVGQVFRDCADCPLLVVIPSGEFMMGSPSDEIGPAYGEGPQHLVRIAKPFLVGVYEVTFDEWDACVSGGGCSHRPEDIWGRGRHPVIDVSWNDAQEYVGWLSSSTGKPYRLLSESEWEYVARAGTTGPFHFGQTVSRDQANYNPGGAHPVGTVPVGSFPPNSFGVHDMHGNVEEWVQDCSVEGYDDAPRDGSARKTGDGDGWNVEDWDDWDGCDPRVLRGGEHGDTSPDQLRSARRMATFKDSRGYGLGFRVARARTLSP